jgi:hypothetical protein
MRLIRRGEPRAQPSCAGAGQHPCGPRGEPVVAAPALAGSPRTQASPCSQPPSRAVLAAGKSDGDSLKRQHRRSERRTISPA